MHRSPFPHKNSRRTKGSALITVTLIGLFVMLLAAALVNHHASTEARAIAESLAKTRIYWASMGHINYALSRISREGLCNGTCVRDDDGTEIPTDDILANRADNLRRYFAEINTSGGPRQWEYGDNYSFSLAAKVADASDPNDGKVRAIIALEAITGSTYDELNGIEQRIRPNLIVDICLAAPCGAPNDSSSGANKIEALRRGL